MGKHFGIALVIGVVLALAPVTAASAARPAAPQLVCELLPILCPPPTPTPTEPPVTPDEPAPEPPPAPEPEPSAPAEPSPSPSQTTTPVPSPSATPLAQSGGGSPSAGQVTTTSTTSSAASTVGPLLPAVTEDIRLANELAGDDGAVQHPLTQTQPVVADAVRAEDPAAVLGWSAAGFAVLALGALGFRSLTSTPVGPRRGRHSG